MKRIVLTTLMLFFSLLAEAEPVVRVSCPGQGDIWLPKAKIDRVGALAGKGDFLPIIEHSDKIHAKQLYMINGKPHGADYLAAVIWSASLSRLGVNCYTEVQIIYESYTGRKLVGYYVDAIKDGLNRH